MSKISQPKKNEVDANKKKILIFEYPNTFNVKRSLLFRIFIMKIMLAMNMIKGKS